jgi:hypothetical protein
VLRRTSARRTSSDKGLAKRAGLSPFLPGSAATWTATLPRSAYCVVMARIMLFGIVAVVALVLLFVLFWHVLHLLILGFWVLLVVLLGFGLFRIGRWSSSRRQK